MKIKYHSFWGILLILVFSLQACGSSLPSPEEEETEDSTSEIPSELSFEATKLLNYMKEIAGKQMLSGCMANVNWNINEALWVFQHTGKYPAINCFDYIHLPFHLPTGLIIQTLESQKIGGTKEESLRQCGIGICQQMTRPDIQQRPDWSKTMHIPHSICAK